MHYYIKPEEWEQIFSILKKFKGLHTNNPKKLRRFLEAIWYIGRRGCQWRLLPRIYGKWRLIHARFISWSRRGIWKTIFEALQKEPDTQAFMIDATIVRAHACAAGYSKNRQEEQALGRSKGGFTTKIHALVDGLGNPLRFTLTAGQRHEITQAPTLIQGLKQALIIADKGYDSMAFIQQTQNQSCIPVIPSRRNRKKTREHDKHEYKERHLIEGFFQKIKCFRRIFSRFEKNAEVFLSFLYFTASFILLR